MLQLVASLDGATRLRVDGAEVEVGNVRTLVAHGIFNGERLTIPIFRFFEIPSKEFVR